MLRLRNTNSDEPQVPIHVDKMGIGRGMGIQDGIDTQTLESLVIMTDEIAAFERDALGLGAAELPDPPRSLVMAPARATTMSRGQVWFQRCAGLAAAIAVAAGAWQHFRTPTVTPASVPGLATERLTGAGESFAFASGHARTQRNLDWIDPHASSRLSYNGEPSPLRMRPVLEDGLSSEDRSLILAVFQDDDSPWCECVRVQTGTLCSGERVDQVSKDDLVTAAMDSSCMVGADRVSIFAFTGPASKLPATREEAEALAITLAQLPVECLKNDPCVQHVASECLPAGVAMVSRTLAINDVKAGW